MVEDFIDIVHDNYTKIVQITIKYVHDRQQFS